MLQNVFSSVNKVGPKQAQSLSLLAGKARSRRKGAPVGKMLDLAAKACQENALAYFISSLAMKKKVL